MNDKLELHHCGCGGEAVVEKHQLYEEQIEDMFIVRCVKCDIQTSPEYKKEKVIEIWNTAMGAKDINVLDKEIVLIEPFDANLTHVGYCMCGELVNIDYSYCPRCGRKIEWRRMTL